MIEGVLHRLLDDALGFGARQPVLGLALELRLADEHGEHRGGAEHHVVAGHRGGLLALAHALGMVLQAAGEGGAVVEEPGQLLRLERDVHFNLFIT